MYSDNTGRMSIDEADREKTGVDYTIGERELGEHAVTNYYVCPNDGWMWTGDNNGPLNDRCPRCRVEVDPCASRVNWGGVLVIREMEDYERMQAANFGYPD